MFTRGALVKEGRKEGEQQMGEVQKRDLGFRPRESRKASPPATATRFWVGDLGSGGVAKKPDHFYYNLKYHYCVKTTANHQRKHVHE